MNLEEDAELTEEEEVSEDDELRVRTEAFRKLSTLGTHVYFNNWILSSNNEKYAVVMPVYDWFGISCDQCDVGKVTCEKFRVQ